MISQGYHPDQNVSGFHPDSGWCQQCARALRVGEVKYFLGGRSAYLEVPAGPFCSQACISAHDPKAIEKARRERDARDTSPY